MITKEKLARIMGDFGAMYVNRASTNDFPAYIQGEVEVVLESKFNKDEIKQICDTTFCDIMDEWEEKGFLHQFGFNEYRDFSLKLLTNDGVIYFSTGAYKA